MRRFVVLAATAAALVLAVPAAADEELTLQPESLGEHTVSSWRGHEGLPDTFGEANQALYLQMGATEPRPAAAAAVARGIEGVPARFLTGLEFEYRIDGRCGTFDPRWTIRVRGRGGRQYILRLGCGTGVRSPGSGPGWIRVTHPQALIRAQLERLAPRGDALAGTIVDLALVFAPRDEVGYVFVDNVTVAVRGRARVFTSAADNGDQRGGTSSFAEALAVDLDQPLSTSESLEAEELLASLTEEEQAIVAMTDEELAAYLGITE